MQKYKTLTAQLSWDKIGDSGKIPDLLKDSNSKLWSLNDMTLNYFDVVLISDLGMYE